MATKPPGGSVDRTYLIRLLGEIADAYRDLFPERYKAHARLMEEHRRHLLKPSGASATGLLQLTISMPEELMTFIDKILRERGILQKVPYSESETGLKGERWQSFMDDLDNIDLLAQVWTEFRGYKK